MTRDEAIAKLNAEQTITFAEMRDVASAEGVEWAESVNSWDAPFMGVKLTGLHFEGGGYLPAPSFADQVTNPQDAPTVQGAAVTRPFR